MRFINPQPFRSGPELGTGIRDVRAATADSDHMEKLYHGSRVRSKLLDPARPVAGRHHARQRAIALLVSRSPGIGSPTKNPSSHLFARRGALPKTRRIVAGFPA